MLVERSLRMRREWINTVLAIQELITNEEMTHNVIILCSLHSTSVYCGSKQICRSKHKLFIFKTDCLLNRHSNLSRQQPIARIFRELYLREAAMRQHQSHFIRRLFLTFPFNCKWKPKIDESTCWYSSRSSGKLQ
jgi:hypothetical protein